MARTQEARTHESKTYPSRVDLWIAVTIGTALMLPLLGGIWHLYDAPAEEKSSALIILLPPLLAGLGLLAIGVPIRYELTDTSLIVKHGFLRQVIPLARIDGAELTSSSASAPAWSLRRLRIDYRSKDGRRAHVHISPKGRQDFLQHLWLACPLIDSPEARRFRRRLEALTGY
ncbi:PH domain-containing protein [Desulfocurvibacter africanus]|uniref:Uncharacterized protein YyaB-like PH domain-containing protein n=1 Tax=Desulfocurvibacter africanus subsp. africanus str. Walvis Bay TaxID=690850 RepID=F3YY97_DESAF|nr:PH domain-containing protein [Desulfocurvibacter africanus]EGJ49541.1 protein of unknown function DUF1200 [Desulfocurvibacter africanus subsp. africanus str. Walvis Bay]